MALVHTQLLENYWIGKGVDVCLRRGISWLMRKLDLLNPRSLLDPMI